jgi:hypothetical protein
MPCIVEDLQGTMQIFSERRCLSQSRRREQTGGKQMTTLDHSKDFLLSPRLCVSVRALAVWRRGYPSLTRWVRMRPGFTRRLAPATALLLINSRHRRATAATKQPAGAKLLRADPRCQAADVQ